MSHHVILARVASPCSELLHSADRESAIWNIALLAMTCEECKQATVDVCSVRSLVTCDLFLEDDHVVTGKELIEP